MYGTPCGAAAFAARSRKREPHDPSQDAWSKLQAEFDVQKMVFGSFSFDIYYAILEGSFRNTVFIVRDYRT